MIVALHLPDGFDHPSIVPATPEAILPVSVCF
jgi:hypothetical protein